MGAQEASFQSGHTPKASGGIQSLWLMSQSQVCLTVLTPGPQTWGLENMPRLPQSTAQTHEGSLQGQLSLASASQLDSGLAARLLESHLPGTHRPFK